MPWHIENDNPECSGFAVVKDADGEIEGCHDTKEQALAQLAALNINVKEQDMADVERAAWTAAYVNNLPDSAFACIDPGGEKDAEGKTVPRSLRHYPHHDASGKVDPAHLANGRARVSQQGTTSCGYDHLFSDHKLPSDQAASQPPRDNLYRAMPAACELRDAGDEMPTLIGHFAVFNQPTEIDSKIEGQFIERIAPGAFAKTFAENRERMRVLFQHGKDPHVGDKVLGMPEVLEEDRIGAHYEVPLFDTTYNRDLLPGLRAGAYGSSFRFRVVREDWKQPKGDGLPERTIREAQVYEFGPVTWPAYAGATAGIRSITDEMTLATVSAEPERLRQLIDYTAPEALSVEAEAQPHPEPERRDPPAITPADQKKETPTVAEPTYRTREDMVARLSELNAIIERLAKVPGVLLEPEQIEWDAAIKERSPLEQQLVAWDARRAEVRDSESDPERRVPYKPPQVIRTKSESDIYDLDALWSRSRSPEERDQLLRDNAMRATEIGSFPHPDSKPDVFRAHIANLLDYKDSPDKELARRILITTSPIYRRMFNKAVTGTPLSPEENRAAALAVVGTTTTGGYMVPAFFDPTIVPIGAFTSINPYRQACRVEQIVGGNKWTAVATGVVTPVRTTEAAVATEAGPTLEQPYLTVHRVATLVTYSVETEQDRPDIASELARVINEGKDTEEENEFTLGDGTGIHAFGMFSIHASVNGFFTHLHTAGAALAHDDAALTEATLPIRHRMNAAWFMSRGTIRAFQALEDVHGTLFGGVGYAYAGTIGTNPAGNTGLKLLGYPIWETPSAVSTTAVADSVIAALCDPKRFVIVDRVGMQVEIIPHILNGVVPTGQRGLWAMWRNTAGSFGAPGAATTGGIRLTVKS